MYITVSIVDDDTFFSDFMVGLLTLNPNCFVHKTAKNAAEMKDLLIDNRTDVYLVDLNLGDESGIDLIKEAKKIRPKAKYMVLSALDDRINILRSIEAGALGYILKDDIGDNIFKRIENVFLAEPTFSPEVTTCLMQVAIEKTRPNIQDDERAKAAKAVGTTHRELQVLSLLRDGLPVINIADRLRISPHTVNQHMRSLYRKLNVRSRAMVVSVGLKLRLIN